MSIKYITPFRLLIVSWGFWFFFYLIIPARYVEITPIWPALLTLLYYNFFFVLGILFINSRNYRSTPHQYSSSRIRNVCKIIFCLGAIGTGIRIFERLFIQGFLSGGGITEFRIETMSTELSGGAAGVISALLYPFSFVCVMVVLYYKHYFRRLEILIVIFIGLYPIIDSILLGGRLAIILLLFILFFLLILRKHRYPNKYKSSKRYVFVLPINNFKRLILSRIEKKYFSLKIIIPLVIGIGIFGLYSVYIITSRISYYGYSDVVSVWEGYKQIDIANYFHNLVNNSPFQGILLSLLSLLHYFVHGVFEFTRLFNFVDDKWGIYFGEYQYYTFFKFFKFLGLDISTFKEINSIVYKRGVYTTFWGPFFLDFGLFGGIISFFYGIIVKRSYIKAINGDFFNLLLYPYFAVIIFGSAYINLMLGSSLYYLNAFILTYFIFKLFKGNS